MQALTESGDASALEAVDLFVYRAARELGAMASTLQGLDTLVSVPALESTLRLSAGKSEKPRNGWALRSMRIEIGAVTRLLAVPNPKLTF